MHEFINQFLFVSAVILQTVTGLKPVQYQAPQFVKENEKVFRFGKFLKKDKCRTR